MLVYLGANLRRVYLVLLTRCSRLVTSAECSASERSDICRDIQLFGYLASFDIY